MQQREGPDTAGEIWKPLLDVPGYEVSNRARIRDQFGVYPRFFAVKQTKHSNPKSYLYWYPEFNHPKKVHRCVLKGFLRLTDEQYKKFVTDHINGKTATIADNHLRNLRWTTYSFNNLNREARGWHAIDTSDGQKYIARLTYNRKSNGKNYCVSKAWDTPFEARTEYLQKKTLLMNKLIMEGAVISPDPRYF